jgi:dihydrolipoamide dehydrogenase
MAVIGLGTIGLELGQSLSAWGSPSPASIRCRPSAARPGPGGERCAIEILGKEFPIHLGQQAEIGEEPDGRCGSPPGEQSVLVDKVLCSIGRVPNVEGLGWRTWGCRSMAAAAPGSTPQHAGGGSAVFIAGDVNGDRPSSTRRATRARSPATTRPTASRPPSAARPPSTSTSATPTSAPSAPAWNDLDPDTTAVGQINFAPVGGRSSWARTRACCGSTRQGHGPAARRRDDRTQGREPGPPARLVHRAGPHVGRSCACPSTTR